MSNSEWKNFNDFCGSEAYACPEILMKIPYSPLLGDIWALGEVFYATLFGRFPFDPKAKDVDPKEFPTELSFPPGHSFTRHHLHSETDFPVGTPSDPFL